jgi:LacI family transcriptional regulator
MDVISVATIKEIARKLGISVSSVSKGLSGASDVSEETRQLILNTAIERDCNPQKQDESAPQSMRICREYGI